MERRWWALIAICAATFMLLLDITIVQVAVPKIQRDFHASLTDLQWIIDAYALALASLILTNGSIADRFGRKRIFLWGVCVFTLASMLCGLAGDSTFLIVARVLQGLGGAAMFATSLALIGQDFSGRERGTAIAAWSATVGGGVAIGPLLGGILTDGLGWQWIFFVNVPVGVAAVLIARAYMVNTADPDAGHLDAAGLVTLSAALFFLVFGVLRGNASGWGSEEIVASFVGAAVELGLFVTIELRAERPMFDLSLLRKPSFLGVSLATFAIGAGMFAMILYITLYLQNLLGFSALDGGLRTLPLTLMVFIVPLATRRLVSRVPARVLLGSGLALVSLGLLLMHGLRTSSHWTALLAGMIIAGVGIGLANPVIGTTALAVVAPTRTGMASGISNTFRVGGVAAGIAALGAIFSHRLASELHAALPHASQRLTDLVSAGGVRAAASISAPAERSQVVAATKHAFVTAFNEILLVGSATVLLGSICAFALIRARDFRATRPQAPAPTADAVPA